MPTRLLVCAFLILGIWRWVGAGQLGATSHVVPLGRWAIVAMDKRVEAVQGDRTRPGEPFVIRIRAEAGYVIMPHTHPIDENIVVVAGSWAIGMGEHFNRDALEAMQVGDYVLAPRGHAHFAWSKSNTIIQVHGTGPFTTQWVTPVIEMTSRGILRKIGPEDPGQPASDIPTDCFALRLGARVRFETSEGVVIGAQCTPHELTQYRIEKEDGMRLWAEIGQLKAL